MHVAYAQSVATYVSLQRAEYAGASTHQTAKVDAEVDFQCISISVLWTLTTPVPWDETKVRP
jgi:hypothetical protein